MPRKGNVMAKKTNCVINGKEYYRIYRKVGKKVNKYGVWVDERKAFYGSCKKDAEEAYQKYMARKNAGPISDKCLGELMDEWIETIFKPSELANSTKVKYISAYKNLLQSEPLAGRPIDEVSALDLQEVYNSSSACYSTTRAFHNLLRRFYSYLELNGIAKNITHSLKVPRKAYNCTPDGFLNDVDVWHDEDVKKVIEALKGSTLRLLIVLAVNTGARFSELLALQYDDIKENNLYINKQLSEIASLGGDVTLHITSTKTASSNRVIPLSAPVLEEITKHKQLHMKEMVKNGYRTNDIFTTSHGTHYYKRNIVRSLERLYRRIGVPYHKFHAYRHTFGTNLSRAGVPIEETAKLMGHSDITMTAKYYININAERKREAIEKIARFSL